MNYSDLSHELTKKISKQEKKENGIYFTPPNTISRNLKLIEPYIKDIKTVLEPSCGSGEYIQSLNKMFKKVKITGIEYNKTIYDSIRPMSSGRVSIINQDYLTYEAGTKYDLIIGNPPYFVMKKECIEKKYHPYFDGRPNIFILFIIKSLGMLSENGLLSFVLPKNFLNCLYYDKTRKYINDHFRIVDIIECDDDYIETKQETVIILIQRVVHPVKNENDPLVLVVNNYTIFGTTHNILQLKTLYNNSTNLSNLSFDVKVGTVVWNQCKTILTHDTTKTRLIYSSDIINNELSIKKYDNVDKKNYIDKSGDTSPLLVINRGYGVGTYKFQYCLINGDVEYLIENHLICIKGSTNIKNEDLLASYEKIICSLNDERTSQFIDFYFGNNAINTTELKYMLPIYGF